MNKENRNYFIKYIKSEISIDKCNKYNKKTLFERTKRKKNWITKSVETVIIFGNCKSKKSDDRLVVYIRLHMLSISLRLLRKFYRLEIIFYDVWFPVYLKNFGGYTFSCSLNNSGLNFLNSKPFVISVLCDLLIQIDLLGFSPLQFFKVSWKKVPARFFCF